MGLVVFDITSKSSFESCKQWVSEMRQHAPPEIIFCLIGNKIDLADNRMVSVHDAAQYAAEIGAIYRECSAKTGDGVDAIFLAIEEKLRAAMLMEDLGHVLQSPPGAPRSASAVNVAAPQQERRDKGCC